MSEGKKACFQLNFWRFKASKKCLGQKMQDQTIRGPHNGKTNKTIREPRESIT